MLKITGDNDSLTFTKDPHWSQFWVNQAGCDVMLVDPIEAAKLVKFLLTNSDVRRAIDSELV